VSGIRSGGLRFAHILKIIDETGNLTLTRSGCSELGLRCVVTRGQRRT
jgi:hypothetical protein